MYRILVLAAILWGFGTMDESNATSRGKLKRADKREILVIGHRGASGYIPEHTLEAYKMAIEQGADFIEPDLVPTKDGVLIARHENEIGGTTDVAKKFPKRKTTKVIDGKSHTGWFTEDFTYKEIKTLRAKERLPFRNQKNNGKYKIVSFEDVLKLAKAESKKRGRTIGVYPETKHPTYFRNIGLPLEDSLVHLLKKYGYTEKISAVFVQSFEVSNLKRIKKMIDVRLVQLIGDPGTQPYDQELMGTDLTYDKMISPKGLKEIATYADGIGPWKGLIIKPNTKKKTVTKLVLNAHKAKLKVHPYTFRNDKEYLPKEYSGNAMAEYLDYFKLGVDGVFSDFPDTAVEAKRRY